MGNFRPPEYRLLHLVSIVGAISGVAIVAGVSAVTDVTVPLLWPLAATLGCLWLAARELQWQYQQRLDADEQLRAASLPPTPTVSSVLHDHRSGVRIGDEQRDIIVTALHTHFAAGRLTQAELDERIEKALAARTIDDLRAIVRDLPSEVTGQ